MMKRLLIIFGTIALMVGSIWLAALSQSHDQLMRDSDCMSSTAVMACDASVEHTVHMLAHQLDEFAASVALPRSQDQLALLLLVALVGVFPVLIANFLRTDGRLRCTNWRDLKLLRIEQQFRAWRVTISELHPLPTH